MTGFGRAAGRADWGDWTVELRSVNGRGLDIRLAIPGGYDVLEQPVKATIKKALHRGNVQATLMIRLVAEEFTGSRLNTRLLSRLARNARSWSRNGAMSPSRFDELVKVRGAILSDTDAGNPTLGEGQIGDILATVGAAVEDLTASRFREGEALSRVLTGIVDEIEVETVKAQTVSNSAPDLIRDRLRQRIDEVLQDSEIDPDRLGQEVAILASKADVREELDRLSAHIVDARQLITSDSPVGRKLEFLSQEFLREANTLGSKSQILDLTRSSLALKALIDQFKEQAANVE